MDIYSNLGVTPRGQKEIPHQPHSVFLLGYKKVGRDTTWNITTGKDIKNREGHFEDRQELFDFAIEYLGLYYNVEK